MQNNVRALRPSEMVQETARVLSVTPDGTMVQTEAGVYRAQRAVSCLVAPEIDDVVLLATSERGTCYVLAVLEREAKATRLSVEGDLELSSADGRVRIAAPEGVDLVSQKRVGVVSAEVKVNAVEAKVATQKATVVGRFLQTEFERVKAFANAIDGVFGRFSQRAKSSIRRVEGLEQLKAEHIDHSAQKTMTLHGENAVVTARQLVKVDGEQIHVG